MAAGEVEEGEGVGVTAAGAEEIVATAVIAAIAGKRAFPV